MYELILDTKLQSQVQEDWIKCSTQEMKEAVDEEISLARQKGDIDFDEVPLLTVVLDGVWSKRSYRTNYNALSFRSCINSWILYSKSNLDGAQKQILCRMQQ